MASSPSYDPNLIESPNGFARIIHSPSACPGSSSALLNRATQGLYPPGSTFKTVTAAAALDSGKYTPDSKFYDPGYCIEYGKKVSNAGDPEAPGAVRQRQPRCTAFQHSINAVFCDIGKALGARARARQGEGLRLLLEAAARDCRRTRSRAAGSTTSRRASSSTRRPGNGVDPGRLAFGQEQAARDAAADGDGRGRRREQRHVMQPHLVKKVTAPGGGTVVKVKPHVLAARDEAEDGRGDQRHDGRRSVEGGTGTARADLRASRSPARPAPPRPGRATSTTPGSSSSRPPRTRCSQAPSWSSSQLNGFGGAVSAPIAKQLMQAILPAASNGL